MADLKLHPAEAKIREDFAADIDRQANLDGLEPDICRAMHKRADMIRGSMPILDFRLALIAYDDALNDGPESGIEHIEYRYGVGQAVQRLKDSNPYPPELERAVRDAMARGVSPDDIDLYQVTGMADPEAAKSAVKPPRPAARQVVRPRFIGGEAKTRRGRLAKDLVNARIAQAFYPEELARELAKSDA